jgi:hypothetical protein
MNKMYILNLIHDRSVAKTAFSTSVNGRNLNTYMEYIKYSYWYNIVSGL